MAMIICCILMGGYLLYMLFKIFEEMVHPTVYPKYRYVDKSKHQNSSTNPRYIKPY